MAVLTVKNLVKKYPSFRLNEVSFDLKEGQITGFIGRNGAGKTTTLHSIMGLLIPDSGEITFWGKRLSDDRFAAKQKIGFVSSGMGYYAKSRLRTITEVTRSFYSQWDENAYRDYMKRFSLEESKTPETLSNGMKIKYMLALALSHNAELFILDEPTSGLDPVSRDELLEILLDLRDKGKTILFSTHVTSDLDKAADHILYISGGSLRADRPADQFLDDYRLVRYLPEALSPGEKALLLGSRRDKRGCTGLIRKEDAPRFAHAETPDLEQIMVHLEKGGEET